MRYLYLETTEEEQKEISKALLCDTELQSLYMDLCTLKKELDKAQLEPSSKTVLNILSYARGIEQKH